jgi:FkbM family methyltransferase
MKAIFKRALGRLVIQAALRSPHKPPLLRSLGFRCSHGLFGKGQVSVATGHTKPLRLTHLDDSYLGFQLFWRGLDYYEPITRLLLSQLLRPGTTFLDIGAHHGFFSLTSALLLDAIRVVAFEPNPENFHILQANVHANELANVVCEPLAISDQDGTARLYLTASDMSASLMQGFQSQDTQQIATVEVQAITLDHYAQSRHLDAPLVIKVDIEGHEAAFMRGAMDTIRKCKPDIILEVVEEQDPNWIQALKALGYRFYPITDQALTETDAPRLVKRFPFLFLNHLLSTRPVDELLNIFRAIEPQIKQINLLDTSKHFRKEEWPLLWPDQQAAIRPVLPPWKRFQSTTF